MYRFIPILFVLAFAGCGGGGGDGAKTNTPGPSAAAAFNTVTQDVAGAKTSTPATTPTPTQPDNYTVEAGDTLGEIAARFGTTVEALVSLNGLTDADQIVVGQVLNLKAAAGTTPSASQ